MQRCLGEGCRTVNSCVLLIGKTGSDMGDKVILRAESKDHLADQVVFGVP